MKSIEKIWSWSRTFKRNLKKGTTNVCMIFMQISKHLKYGKAKDKKTLQLRNKPLSVWKLPTSMKAPIGKYPNWAYLTSIWLSLSGGTRDNYRNQPWNTPKNILFPSDSPTIASKCLKVSTLNLNLDQLNLSTFQRLHLAHDEITTKYKFSCRLFLPNC